MKIRILQAGKQLASKSKICDMVRTPPLYYGAARMSAGLDVLPVQLFLPIVHSSSSNSPGKESFGGFASRFSDSLCQLGSVAAVFA